MIRYVLSRQQSQINKNSRNVVIVNLKTQKASTRKFSIITVLNELRFRNGPMMLECMPCPQRKDVCHCKTGQGLISGGNR